MKAYIRKSVLIHWAKKIALCRKNNYREAILITEAPISLSGIRVFDFEGIRLSETVFFRKNRILVLTYVHMYNVPQ
jgi:hypothetical protein